MRRRFRLGASVAVVSAVVLTALVPLATARADDVPAPSQWPSSVVASPQIESWPNAIRFAGPNREQTALALALGLRGAGDYPFDTTDPSSSGAPTLASANDWWGVGTCPRAIIVVAGDTPADSLGASALSDPTDKSSEPYLARSAAADPLFDPIGGFARVDTDTAPIIVTRSARQGATSLGAPARIAARDLRSGGCRLARQAIIVGGPAAVPALVESELVTLGYSEVFRIAGANRYATAARIADALGTGSFIPAGRSCADPAVNDGDARMGFYSNAAIEVRDSSSTCRVLGRTVVLAEGTTGADALAAGWWTSFWQVPVLLHDGSKLLPAATVEALSTLPIDHVVVLGGTSRISEAIIDEVEQLTGALTERIAGPDRYATSVEMAQRLGGWWPTGNGDDFAGSMACVVASSGTAATGLGWPDALAAGPWCAAANPAASGRGAPMRALGPLVGGEPSATTSPTSTHDAVPVLLVPAAVLTLPPVVDDLLSASFDPSNTYCSSEPTLAACVSPGFVIAAGGATVLSSQLIAAASEIVAGGTPAVGSASPARLDAPFLTSLDLSPVFATDPAGITHVCVQRGGYPLSRWLSLRGPSPSSVVVAESDVMLDGRYVNDADGVIRTPGTGAPACVSTRTPGLAKLLARGVGLAGRVGPEQAFSSLAIDRLTQTAVSLAVAPDPSSGVSTSDATTNGAMTTQTYTTTTPSAIVSRGVPTVVSTATITINLVRGADRPRQRGVDRYSANLTLSTPDETIVATSSGEAVFSGGVWHLRGQSTVTADSWSTTIGRGGFRADLDPGDNVAAADDSIAWQIDAVVSG